MNERDLFLLAQIEEILSELKVRNSDFTDDYGIGLVDGIMIGQLAIAGHGMVRVRAQACLELFSVRAMQLVN